MPLNMRTGPQQFRKEMLSGPEGPAQTAPLTRNIFPPWVYKLPTSVDFNQNLFTSVLAAGAGNTVTPVSVSLSPTNVGWVQIMGIYVLAPLNTTDITFTLQVNGSPVAGWDTIKPPPGAANFVVQNFSDLQVRAPNGCTVSIVVTNNSAAGPWTVGAKVAGWFHSYADELRIYGTL